MTHECTHKKHPHKIENMYKSRCKYWARDGIAVGNPVFDNMCFTCKWIKKEDPQDNQADNQTYRDDQQ